MKTITIYDDDYKTLDKAADREDTTIAEIIGEMICDRVHGADDSGNQYAGKKFYAEYAMQQIEKDREYIEMKKKQILSDLNEVCKFTEKSIEDIGTDSFYINCNCDNSINTLMNVMTTAREIILLNEKISMVEKLL